MLPKTSRNCLSCSRVAAYAVPEGGVVWMFDADFGFEFTAFTALALDNGRETGGDDGDIGPKKSGDNSGDAFCEKIGDAAGELGEFPPRFRAVYLHPPRMFLDFILLLFVLDLERRLIHYCRKITLFLLFLSRFVLFLLGSDAEIKGKVFVMKI